MDENKSSNTIFKQDYDAYVICSTLNQMVNYIPIKMLQDSKRKVNNIINIKVNSGGTRRQFNSDNWDENLIEVLKEDIEIPNAIFSEVMNRSVFKYFVKLPRKFDLDVYKREIEKQLENDGIKSDKILWNITGGQRSTIIAIKELVRERYKNGHGRKQDVIVYLEGNTNDMIIGTCNESDEIKYCRYVEEGEEKYKIKDLTIEKSMRLAGFNLFGSQKIYDNYLELGYTIENLDDDLDRFYKAYICKDSISRSSNDLKKYKELTKSEKLRLDLIATSKKSNGVYVGKTVWEAITKEKEYDFMKPIKDFLDKRYGENTNKFGYLLELITIHRIRNTINKYDSYLKDYFVDLKHSLKLKNEYDNLERNNQFCEFDIVLLTRAGQIIIFECKSGAMTGDVAKSRHYTTYAVGGVYGIPIIITPLLSEEINDNSNYIERKKSNEKYENIYNSIYSAINAAKKSNMDVWGIDELDVKLEELFQDVFGLGE